ncbi:MAG: hypothetical protein A2V87_04190 [Deltaproteobacteria bacterium RBG_16_58_17]|nr:MAG: hypothetical protein A2V87_04190 [Deltaproteobacteria bacterium RBG_16_58_17]
MHSLPIQKTIPEAGFPKLSSARNFLGQIMAFPGYVSGDILRGFYVFRHAAEDGDPGAAPDATPPKASPQTVVASIVFDRAAGLLSLFILSLAGLMEAVWRPLPPRLALSVGLVAGAGLAGMLFLFWFAYWFPSPPAFSVRLTRIVRCDQPLTYLHAVTHYYVRNLRLIAKILGISFITQGAGLTSFVLFGLTLIRHCFSTGEV